MWILYALLAAASFATTDALSKRVLRSSSLWIVAWVRLLFAFPILVVFLFFIHIPPLPLSFWITIMILGPLDILALLLYVRSIQVSPLSLTVPFLSLSPAFVIPVGWVLLGERIDLSGLSGIGLIVLGAYTLHLNSFRKGWTAPLRAIFRENGSRLMIVVAALFSVTSSLGKVAILQSSPGAFGTIYFIILTVGITPIILLKSRDHLSDIPKHLPACVAIGLLFAMEILFHVLAISQIEAAYMIAVKRMSILFGMIYGFLLFGEPHLRLRLSAGLIMLAGVIILSIR